MLDPKHQPTIERLRKLGRFSPAGCMVYADEVKEWHVAWACAGLSVDQHALASLIADLLNEAVGGGE